MKPRWWIFAAVLLTAIFFRFYRLSLSPPGLFMDEAVEGNQALAGELRVFYPENHGREGLYVWLAAGPLRILGNKPFVLRGVSAFFGTLTVVGLYLLVSELYGWELASIAALLLASSFWHTVVSRFGVRVVLAPCVACYAFWALARAVRSRRLSAWATAGALFGLGFYTYLPFRILPLAVFVFVLCSRRYTSRRELCVLVGMALLVLAPLIWHFTLYPEDLTRRMKELSIGSGDLLENVTLTALMFSFQGDGQWQHNIPGTATLPVAIGLFFMLGIVAALRRREIWLLMLLVLSLVPAILSEAAPHSLRAILAVMPVYTLAAGGMWWLFEDTRKSHPRVAQLCPLMLGLVLAGSVFEEAWKYFDWSRRPEVAKAYASWNLDFAEWLMTLPREQKKYVYINARIVGADLDYPAQTVMFVTDTYTRQKQLEKNLFYTIDLNNLPKDAIVIPLFQ